MSDGMTDAEKGRVGGSYPKSFFKATKKAEDTRKREQLIQAATILQEIVNNTKGLDDVAYRVYVSGAVERALWRLNMALIIGKNQNDT